MVSGIRFFASSGAFGNTIASLYTAGRAEPGGEIFALLAGDTESPNRIGFFGLGGAPSSPVVVGTFQERTHITNHAGDNLGILCNAKYTGASTAEISGVAFTAGLENITSESGTLLLRFREPNDQLVTTQNGVFRAIDLTAASGAPVVTDLVNDVTVYAAQLPDTDGFTGDTAWTLISNGGAALSLENQSAECTIHDYHVIVSASPDVAGRKVDWAFYAQVEYL